MQILAMWLAALSIITFAAYGIDKAKAKAGAWRIPEKTLHGLALAGGFLGGWFGMFVFHHKTRKPAFRVVLAVATVLWVLIVGWVLASGT